MVACLLWPLKVGCEKSVCIYTIYLLCLCIHSLLTYVVSLFTYTVSLFTCMVSHFTYMVSFFTYMVSLVRMHPARVHAAVCCSLFLRVYVGLCFLICSVFNVFGSLASFIFICCGLFVSPLLVAGCFYCVHSEWSTFSQLLNGLFLCGYGLLFSIAMISLCCTFWWLVAFLCACWSVFSHLPVGFFWSKSLYLICCGYFVLPLVVPVCLFFVHVGLCFLICSVSVHSLNRFGFCFCGIFFLKFAVVFLCCVLWWLVVFFCVLKYPYPNLYFYLYLLYVYVN